MARLGRKREPAIITKPNADSLRFGDKFINIRGIARLANMQPASVSKILSGKIIPKIDTARRLASVLGLTLDEMLYLIDERVAEREQKKVDIVQGYLNRVKLENQVDATRRFTGKPPVHRLPALRLPKENS